MMHSLSPCDVMRLVQMRSEDAVLAELQGAALHRAVEISARLDVRHRVLLHLKYTMDIYSLLVWIHLWLSMCRYSVSVCRGCQTLINAVFWQNEESASSFLLQSNQVDS